MGRNKYWKGINELEQTDAFKAVAKKEFADELPVLDAVEEKSQTLSPRRDFLKMLGYSLGAATIAASCETPIRKAIPYVICHRLQTVVPVPVLRLLF